MFSKSYTTHQVSLYLEDSLDAGSYYLSTVLYGPSSLDYHASFDSNVFDVREQFEKPMIPSIVKALFADSGSYILVIFDSPTDLGGSSTSFQCSMLFQFTGVSQSKCTWNDLSSVKIYNVAEVDVSDSLTVKGEKIKAACKNFPQSKCDTWSKMTEVTVKILPPISPIYPTIQASMPSQLGTCTNLTIDITSSSGLCGRGWSNLTFEVVTKAPTMVRINAHMTSSIATIMTLPYAMLIPDFEYSFLIGGCNFLGRCSSIVKEISVINDYLPLVRFVGSPIRHTLVANIVSVKASADMVSKCGNVSSDISTDISYSWSIMLNSKMVVSIDSLVKDPTKYVLPAYSLKPSSVYDITVIASVNKKDGSTAAVSATVTVIVDMGELQAIIQGNYQKSVKLYRSILLDASPSRDSDIDPKSLTSEISSDLLFSWTCSQIRPVLSDSCKLDLISTSSSTIEFYSNTISINSTSLVTVTVTDALTSRKAKTSVEVVVIPPSAPLITIDYTGDYVTKDSSIYINPSEKLKLLGSIQNEEYSLSSTAAWTIEESIVLSELSLTALQIDIPTQSVYTVTSFNLALKMNALPPGSTFTFKLVVTEVTGMKYTGFASVMTNGVPFGGSLDADPSNGIAIQTNFKFVASHWEDDDIPLTYSFGFTKTAEDIYDAAKTLDVRSRSELSYCTTQLPSGDTIGNATSNLTIIVTVFDFYSASSIGTTELSIRPTNISSADLSTMLSRLPKDIDSLLPMLAAGISIATAVNCTNAPSNCQGDYNRYPCSKVSGTCGQCLPGYIGDGDSNTPCLNPDDIMTFNETIKPCPSFDCSMHGKCTYVNINTGKTLAECMMTDITCNAVCECDEDYFGDDCSMDDAEIKAKKALKGNTFNP